MLQGQWSKKVFLKLRKIHQALKNLIERRKHELQQKFAYYNNFNVELLWIRKPFRTYCSLYVLWKSFKGFFEWLSKSVSNRTLFARCSGCIFNVKQRLRWCSGKNQNFLNFEDCSFVTVLLPETFDSFPLCQITYLSQIRITKLISRWSQKRQNGNKR